jgi:hypothetical protein
MNIFCPNCSVFIKNIKIFGSIVVSISACHSKEQLAGGRGSIPRQRDITILFFFPSFIGCCGGVVELWGRWTSFGEDWSVRPAVFSRASDSITWDGEVGLALF